MKYGVAIAMVLALGAGAPTVMAEDVVYQPPRTADGKPDLTGFWKNTSLTSLERPGQFKSLVIPEADATRIEAARAAANERANQPTDPTTGAPRAGQDVGGYNNFYVDAGTHYAKINGEIRSSWIVEPADGRIPYTAAGRKAFEDALAFVRNTFDGPESRPMAERCLVGFGSTGGPPMINVMYNNTYQFTQTPDHVVITVEMNHDARIIPLHDNYNQSLPQWLGNSKGRWDGDTLVVTTTNFNPGDSLRTFFNASYMLAPDTVVEERFTRVSDSEIRYDFTVTDPNLFSQPWRAEKIFDRADAPPYEYACHEGNYSMPNILEGARKNDALGLANYADEGE